ncbi:MAG: hypothetical protein MOB07_08190 [Acidobacteria bacterium]|nr:hypothetical protein [Acidobacteriota bacterium]
MEHRVETRIEHDGTIILHDLPFHEGEKVVVVITTRSVEADQKKLYPLRGLPVVYKNPFESVAENEWSAMQ